MLTVKEYNVKLARLKSTRKMTKTMKMVSANKLRKAQKAQKDVSTFEQKLNSIVDRIGVEVSIEDHPMLNPKRAISKALIASSRSIRCCIDQPITWRENRSSTTDRYSQPSCVRI